MLGGIGMWGECRKICWGEGEVGRNVGNGVGRYGEVRGSVGKCREKCGEVYWDVREGSEEVWESVLGCGGGEKECEERCWERCGKCVGVWGELREDEERSLGVWESVGEVSGECAECKETLEKV